MAGDMFLGACLDLGMPLAVIERAVDDLGVGGLGVRSRRAERGGVAGVRFQVVLDGVPVEGPDPDQKVTGQPPGADGGPVSLAELRRSLSRLPARIASRALALLERLAGAEAEAAGASAAPVDWPRAMALDLLVDLAGAAAALDHLQPERLTCGTVYLGGGEGPVGGRAPSPGATTAVLLAGVPVAGGAGGELVTPTGAVLLAELVDEFRPLPPMRVTGTGFGLGRAVLAGRPNALRLWQGESAPPPTEPPAREGEV